jgi:putative transposase
LTVAKEKYSSLKRVAAQVLQQTLKRLEQAFTSMWERDFGFFIKKPWQFRSKVFSQPGKNPLRSGKVKLLVNPKQLAKHEKNIKRQHQETSR